VFVLTFMHCTFFC